MSDRCKSCGAEIVWVRDQNGTRVPLNKTRVQVYLPPIGEEEALSTTYVTRLSEGRMITGGSFLDRPPMLYHISHFITCPQASSHSKRKP